MFSQWRKISLRAFAGLLSMVFCGGYSVGAAVKPLQPLIDEARPGEVLALADGVYQGPVRIDKPLSLVGTGRTVIDGGGEGPVIVVDADGVRLEGLVIRHSGNRSKEDQAGLLIRGSRAEIRQNRFENCAVGIILTENDGNRIVGNRFDGDPHQPVHMRGNAVDLDRSHRNVVSDNRIDGFMDGIYLERSVGNTLTHNEVSRSRYGFHFMIQADRNEVRHNEVKQSLIGILVMDSNEITMRRNVLHGNRAYQGYGAVLYGTRESKMLDNVLADNAVGIRLEKATDNRIEGNTIVGNQLGLEATADTADNRIVRNQFVANQWQVRQAGRWNNALDDGEAGNFWDDYAGMDRNGDGIGDVPHRTQRWFSVLSRRFPALQLYDHSPAVAALMSAPVGGVGEPVDRYPLARPLGAEKVQVRPVSWHWAMLFGAIFFFALLGLIIGSKKERMM